MDKFSIKNQLKFGSSLIFIVCLSFSLSKMTWATQDSTTVTPPAIKPGSIYLLDSGLFEDVYAGVNASPAASTTSKFSYKQCPSGLNTYINVAFRHGYVGTGSDEGIRGIHLKVSAYGKVLDGSGRTYINFSEAYVDTVGKDDKPIDISYWIYCGP